MIDLDYRQTLLKREGKSESAALALLVGIVLERRLALRARRRTNRKTSESYAIHVRPGHDRCFSFMHVTLWTNSVNRPRLKRER